jgi:uncharacterized protein YkwD
MALLTSDRHVDLRSSTGLGLPSLRVRRTAAPVPPTTVQAPASRTTTRRRPVVATAVTAVLALGVAGTSTAVTLQENARRAEILQHDVAVAATAAAADAELFHQVDVAQVLAARTARAAEMASRGAAIARATPAVEAARAALAAAPQASPESRAALQAAIDVAAGLAIQDPLPHVETMDAAAAALGAPQGAVAASQAEWQAAENARVAAEAEAAARAAAAAPRTAEVASRSTGSAARAQAPAAAAPAAGAAAPSASGVPEFSAGALGEAINAYRASNGLPALSISRSGSLYAHAAAMAEAGGIWHSGSDKIVGFVKPASASSLVRAWAGSPAHNAWMLSSGVSSMQVGAAQLGGRLYGAVNFG